MSYAAAVDHLYALGHELAPTSPSTPPSATPTSPSLESSSPEPTARAAPPPHSPASSPPPATAPPSTPLPTSPVSTSASRSAASRSPTKTSPASTSTSTPPPSASSTRALSRISVITDIALDHQDYLGNTIAEIAREKAGILRPNGTLITLPQHPEANQAIGEAAATLNLHAIIAANYLPARRSLI